MREYTRRNGASNVKPLKRMRFAGLSWMPGRNTICSMRNIAGVTLIEMVFGLAIVGILAGMAVPGFRQSLRASAVRAATYELLAGLQQARANSIVESQPAVVLESIVPYYPREALVHVFAQVLDREKAERLADLLTLCPSDPAGNCLPAATAGAFWRWSVEAPGRAPELGVRALPEGVVARSSRSPIRFSPNAVSASNATLTICDLQAVAPPRAIVISVTGRARTTAAAEAACR